MQCWIYYEEKNYLIYQLLKYLLPKYMLPEYNAAKLQSYQNIYCMDYSEITTKIPLKCP